MTGYSYVGFAFDDQRRSFSVNILFMLVIFPDYPTCPPPFCKQQPSRLYDADRVCNPSSVLTIVFIHRDPVVIRFGVSKERPPDSLFFILYTTPQHFPTPFMFVCNLKTRWEFRVERGQTSRSRLVSSQQ